MPAAPAVAVRSLTKRFGRQLAVDDLSFEVHPGQVVGFLGPNGAGKSTTLRMIVGLTAPSGGDALVQGQPFRQLDDPARTVGSVVDGVDYHPGRRAIDELRISASSAGIARSRCEEVLDLVRLTEASGKRVGKFSLGMRQRLGIAQALLGDPQVLLLDEPANGLDPEGIRWIRSLLRELADQGRAVLVSSHFIGEIARLADDVIVIQRGRFVTQGPVSELTASGGTTVVVASEDDAALASVLGRHDGLAATVEDGGLRVTGGDAATVGRVARDAGIALTELRSQGAELEDVFLELTAEEATASAPPAADATAPPPVSGANGEVR